MPRAPKDPELRQRTNSPAVGEVPADEPESIELPKPKSAWLPSTKVSWERYWTSPARHVTIATLDLDGLERLWDLYDERERAHRAIRAPIRARNGKALRGTDHRLVEGSQGQLRPNGLYNVIARLDAEIRQLEDRAGKSPKARLAIGMRVVGDADPGNGAGDEDQPGDRRGDEPDDDFEVRDPRLYVVDRRAG